MLNIQTAVETVLLEDIDARIALVSGYMNMSGYAQKIKTQVEESTKKPVTTNAIVVSLSRVKELLKNKESVIKDVKISNITTKLPLSELIYENTSANLAKLEQFHKKVSFKREDFFTTTISTTELNIVCSSSMASVVMDHFGQKPKFVAHNLAAIGISFDQKYFEVPNILFSLIATVARVNINIAEIVSTYTELIIIVHEKDFSKVVSLFSNIHKKQSGRV